MSATTSRLSPQHVLVVHGDSDAVVSYDGAANNYPAFLSALSTTPYQTGGYLYQRLPGVYQSYDTALPPPSPALDPADLSKGQLQRFLEMFGLEFDLLRSYGISQLPVVRSQARLGPPCA